MNINCGNIGREEEFLNIANINILNRCNNTRVILVLSIPLATLATSASVERANSKERVPNVPC